MRLTNEQLEVVKKQYGVDRLYSWSKVNTFMTSPYEYYLKYVAHEKEDNDNCAYATLGGVCHDIIEKMYKNEIDYNDMNDNFEDGWTTAIDIADLKFDRNDETKNNNIKNKYHDNLVHFFDNHNKINYKLVTEFFLSTKIGNSVLQGYVDAMYKDENGIYTIIDWKTSTQYKGKTADEKSGQLVVYALGLNQRGVPIDKIRICWNFLKYCTIEYQRANGAVKTRDVERSKIGESLQANAKMWLKKLGYENELDDYLMKLLDTNSISCLPIDVQNKYNITDCYTFVPLTDKLIDNWCNEIISNIKDIEAREKDYNETHNDKIFWDTNESVEKESYYFATLCGYSANLHKPYKAYLERLEAKNNGDIFAGDYGNDNDEDSYNSSVNTKNNNNDIDLSWLDSL